MKKILITEKKLEQTKTLKIINLNKKIKK